MGNIAIYCRYARNQDKWVNAPSVDTIAKRDTLAHKNIGDDALHAKANGPMPLILDKKYLWTNVPIPLVCGH